MLILSVNLVTCTTFSCSLVTVKAFSKSFTNIKKSTFMIMLHSYQLTTDSNNSTLQMFSQQ